jgi:PAS domain S-box-containing protein
MAIERGEANHRDRLYLALREMMPPTSNNSPVWRSMNTAEPISQMTGSQVASAAAAGHTVQFYQDDSFLIESLRRFIGGALIAGDCALIIANEKHRNALCESLRLGGLNFTPALNDGRFVCLDVAETLAQFLVDGMPDPVSFKRVIGKTVAKVAEKAGGGTRRIAAFGEMVAALWSQGNAEAAIRLEQLWNELAEQHSFELHCAYPLNLFSETRDAEAIATICAHHSAVTPGEEYTKLAHEDERLRSIVVLQQKARALETEIREREKAQLALQTRETELRDFVDNAVIPMHWVASDGTIVWANRAELNLLNYEADEYIGRPISDFHADSDAIKDILERLAGKEELTGYKARLRCKDGTARIVRLYSNQSDDFGHTRCFTIDITDRERSERRIAAQLAITRLLAHSQSLAEIGESVLQTACAVSHCDMGAVWEVEEEHGYMRCVKTWHRPGCSFPQVESLTAASRLKKGEGMPGRIWKNNQPAWIPDLASDPNFPRKDAALQDGLRAAFGFPIAAKDRVVGVIEFFSREIQQPDEEFMTMMAGISIQLGHFVERRQADDARNKLAAIVESSDDAIVSKNLRGIVMSWNGAAERIFGYKAEEIIGKPITLIIPPELQDDEPKILSKIQSGDRIDHFETVRVAKDGRRLDISLTISPVKDEDGRIIGAAKIARDITKQRKLEAALHTSERLASVGRLAATVAHEINNPLEAVTNYIFLAKKQPELSEKTQKYLYAADGELARVAHIAQQTLGFYRDNSRPVILSVAKAIDDVISIYERKSRYKELKLVLEVQPNLTLCTFPGELKQILSNLVANAIDASDEGGKIIIRAHNSSRPRDGVPGVRITIADTGTGISEQDKGRVFEPFFTTKKDLGTGLGLWITKDLLQKQGGHISLRSRQSKPSGTVMSIYLPTSPNSASHKGIS